MLDKLLFNKKKLAQHQKQPLCKLIDFGLSGLKGLDLFDSIKKIFFTKLLFHIIKKYCHITFT